MALVAGVDSSTQSCKVLVVDADTGRTVRSGRAPHPDGTAVDPRAWWSALTSAIEDAGGLDDVEALSVAGQQHGMVALDSRGEIVRDALLWNDTRSAPQAESLIGELGAEAWVERSGSVPVASYTVTKLAWMRENEEGYAARTAAVALPHDWLTWRLLGSTDLDDLVTDRSDASGTGYWNPATGDYDQDLLSRALGQVPTVPRVLAPNEAAGRTGDGILLGPGCGDNAGAALGLGAGEGDVIVSIGTSGVVTAVTPHPVTDPRGLVSGFADATGQFLPLVATLNAARVLDGTAQLLGMSHDELDAAAGRVPLGADGLTLVPYLEGERTPNEPFATGSLHGLTLATMAQAHLARAAVDGIACSLAYALDQIRGKGLEARRLLLIGGAARSITLRQALADVMGVPVEMPEPAEWVARGAARQAAWVLSGLDTPPAWPTQLIDAYRPATSATALRERYDQARVRILPRQPE